MLNSNLYKSYQERKKSCGTLTIELHEHLPKDTAYNQTDKEFQGIFLTK